MRSPVERWARILAVALLLLLAGFGGSLAAASAAPRAETCTCGPGCTCPCCVGTDDEACGACFQGSSSNALTVHSPPRAFPQALPCARLAIPPQPVRGLFEVAAVVLSDPHPARLLRPPRRSLAA